MSILEQKKQKLLQFKGGLAAVITPYNQKGEVDVTQISGYVKYLVDNKVDGVYIAGTTGEGYNLTNDEKLEIAKAWRQAIDTQKANLLSVINITSTCLKEALHLAKEVESLGFDAIAVLPPNYYKPNTINDWVSYMKTFGNAAPNTPLLYYHIPFLVGDLNFNILDAIGEGLKEVPQFAAIKYTDYDVGRFILLQKKYSKTLKVLIGFDEVLLTALIALECDAGICALFNIPEVMASYKMIIKSVDASDLVTARKEQDKIVDECVKHKSSGNFYYSLKTTFNARVKHLGLDFGLPRPPIYYHYNWN